MDTSWLLALSVMFLATLLLGTIHLYLPRMRPVLFIAYPALGVAVGLWYGWHQSFPPMLTLFLSLAIGLIGVQAYRIIHRHIR